jgi:hypothetical protein
MFLGRSWFFLPKIWFIQEGQVCPEILIQQPVEVPIVRTRKSLTGWSHLIDHWRAELSTILEFGTSEVLVKAKTQKFSPIRLLFCLEAEFSSEVDLQNFITSKLFVGWSWISNWWKSGRVSHLFGIQLKGRIQSEHPHMLFFFRCCNLSITQFQQLHHRPKIVMTKPSATGGHTNDCWKPEKVLFDFGIQPMVRFPAHSLSVVISDYYL